MNINVKEFAAIGLIRPVTELSRQGLSELVALARIGWPGASATPLARDNRKKLMVWLALSVGGFRPALVAAAFNVSDDYIQHCLTLGARVFANINPARWNADYLQLSAMESVLTAFLSSDPTPPGSTNPAGEGVQSRTAATTRSCLYCRGVFESSGPANRICGACVSEPDRMSADSNPFLGRFK